MTKKIHPEALKNLTTKVIDFVHGAVSAHASEPQCVDMHHPSVKSTRIWTWDIFELVELVRKQCPQVSEIQIAGEIESLAEKLFDQCITTGTSAAMLNPDYVTRVKWWEHPDFTNRISLEAAELVAFDEFEPVLRSQGATRDSAKKLYKDNDFQDQMHKLFQNEPTGCLVIPTLQDALN